MTIDAMIHAYWTIHWSLSDKNSIHTLDQWISPTPPRHRIFCEVDAAAQFGPMPSKLAVRISYKFTVIES